MKNSQVKIIELELTTLCQASCALCYRNYKSYKDHYPKNIVRPLGEVTSQLDLYENLDEIRLVGSVSEPTLYPYFYELVSYIKNRAIKIELCTNGDSRDATWWGNLAKYMDTDDQVYFSICGSTEELHQTYRRGTSLANILNNASSFREGGLGNDYAQCIRFEYNDANFDSDEFKALAGQFTHIYWTETFLLKDPDNYTDTGELPKLKPLKSKQDKYFKIAELSKSLYLRGGSEMMCQASKDKAIQIDVYGQVYPCYLFLEASEGKPWDGDWGKIRECSYEVCQFCQKHIYNYCLRNDMLAIT